jgi:hypothetical protein
VRSAKTGIDPELLRQTGIALTPEGNAHQAEFTADNRFFIGTEEDFGPYRARIVTDDGAVYDAGGVRLDRPEQRALRDLERPAGLRRGGRSRSPQRASVMIGHSGRVGSPRCHDGELGGVDHVAGL